MHTTERYMITDHRNIKTTKRNIITEIRNVFTEKRNIKTSKGYITTAQRNISNSIKERKTSYKKTLLLTYSMSKNNQYFEFFHAANCCVFT